MRFQQSRQLTCGLVFQPRDPSLNRAMVLEQSGHLLVVRASGSFALLLVCLLKLDTIDADPEPDNTFLAISLPLMMATTSATALAVGVILSAYNACISLSSILIADDIYFILLFTRFTPASVTPFEAGWYLDDVK